MRNVALLLVLLFSLSSFNNEERTKVNFYEGAFVDLKAKAKTEKKPFFLEFYTIWCGPCKQMDKYTFTDPTLVKYVESNYLAYKVDAESLFGDGIELAQAYNVMFYPTIIIFSPEGKVLKRLTGPQSASSLITELKKFKDVKESAVSIPSPPQASAEPELEKPIRPTGEGLYKVDIEKQPSEGYGVQIGVYGEYENVIQEMGKLSDNWHKNILMNVNQLKDKTVFRVILGPFPTKQMAQNYKDELKQKEGRDGLVVNLKKYK